MTCASFPCPQMCHRLGITEAPRHHFLTPGSLLPNLHANTHTHTRHRHDPFLTCSRHRLPRAGGACRRKEPGRKLRGGQPCRQLMAYKSPRVRRRPMGRGKDQYLHETGRAACGGEGQKAEVRRKHSQRLQAKRAPSAPSRLRALTSASTPSPGVAQGPRS